MGWATRHRGERTLLLLAVSSPLYAVAQPVHVRLSLTFAAERQLSMQLFNVLVLP